MEKYTNLALEIKNIWDMREVDIIPAVILIEGVVTKKFKSNLIAAGVSEQLLRKIQRTTISRTCHIVRKFLNSAG